MLHAIPAARRSSEEACTSRTRRCAAGADAALMSRVIHHTTQQLVTKWQKKLMRSRAVGIDKRQKGFVSCTAFVLLLNILKAFIS
jgi:hypothetical protein